MKITKQTIKTIALFGIVWLTATLATGYIHGSLIAASIGTTTGTIIALLVYHHYLTTGKPSRTELLTGILDTKPLQWRHFRFISIVLATGIISRLTLGTVHDLLTTTNSTSHDIVNTPDPSVSYILGLILMAVIIGPLLEELVFRNGLQKLLTEHIPAWTAITITSLAFAILHVPSYGGFTAPLMTMVVPIGVVFVDSLLFGWAYDRTQNIFVPMICHGLSNTIAVVVTVLSLW